VTDRTDGLSARQPTPVRPTTEPPHPGLPHDAGRHCARCNAAVRWRETKFCLDRRTRFGGRVYCIGCQSTFPAVEA
jgi:hypothetical protein